MADHDRIWLSPRCPTCAGEERTWCQNNEWTGNCDPPECTVMPTEYVRADLAAAWQPIETAPRDGTVIDLWFAGDWNKRMCNFAWRGNYWASDYNNGYNDNPRIITHWRPLPAGPLDTKHPEPA